MIPQNGSASDRIALLVREEWGRLSALLLSRHRRLDLVEDALGDAVETATRTWPRDGIPDNPSGWVVTVAGRRITDRLRAEAMAHRKEPMLLVESSRRRPEGVMVDDDGHVEDDLLRLVLMCTHPALAPEVAAALALRLVLRVPTADVARLFLVPEPTMAARITRGKKKIVAAGIPFAIPGVAELPDRLAIVAQTAYLAFTAGYAAGSGPDLVRVGLAGEAIRLVRVTRAVVGPQPELDALLALMLLQHSRRDARADAAGELVLLAEQDRSVWQHDEIAEGVRLLAAVSPAPTAWAHSIRLQALIASEHALAPRAQDTRWARIVTLYDALREVNPSPAVLLARVVAVAESGGPEAGLAELEELGGVGAGHRAAAVRAELCARRGRSAEAMRAYDEAIASCANDTERRHLQQRRAAADDLGRDG